MSDRDLPEQFTELQQNAAMQHELFMSYCQAGFLPDQALYLVAAVIGGKLWPPFSTS